MTAIVRDQSETKTIAIALTLGTLGAALFLVLPGFVGALQRFYGFDDVRLGYLSSAHLTGMTLGTALGAPLISRLGTRKTTLFGVLVAASGNAAAILLRSYGSLFTLIFVSGIGAGVAVAACFILLGKSTQVERNFSLYNITQMVFGAAALKCLPALSNTVGVRGLFAVLAALFVVSLPLIQRLPGEFRNPASKARSAHSAPVAWLALGANAIFFMAQCLVWAYLQLIGENHGLSQQAVANAIALSSLSALLGPVAVVLTGSQWGRIAPLSVSLLISLAGLYLLDGSDTDVKFTVGACLFNIAWNLSACYLPAIVAAADRSGAATRWVAFATLAGIAVGPFLSALVVDATGLKGVPSLGAALGIISFVGFVPACIRGARNVL